MIKEWQTSGRYQGIIKDEIESELKAINNTIHVFEVKDEILKITNSFINIHTKFKLISSQSRELTDLKECLENMKQQKY